MLFTVSSDVPIGGNGISIQTYENFDNSVQYSSPY